MPRQQKLSKDDLPTNCDLQLDSTLQTLQIYSNTTLISSQMRRFYESCQFLDLSMICKDGIILKCHSLVASAFSPILEQLVATYSGSTIRYSLKKYKNRTTAFLQKNDESEGSQIAITVSHIAWKDLDTVIRFMYTNEIVMESLDDLLRISDVASFLHLRGFPTNEFLVKEFQRRQEVSKIKCEEERKVNAMMPKIYSTLTDTPETNELLNASELHGNKIVPEGDSDVDKRSFDIRIELKNTPKARSGNKQLRLNSKRKIKIQRKSVVRDLKLGYQMYEIMIRNGVDKKTIKRWRHEDNRKDIRKGRKKLSFTRNHDQEDTEALSNDESLLSSNEH